MRVADILGRWWKGDCFCSGLRGGYRRGLDEVGITRAVGVTEVNREDKSVDVSGRAGQYFG